jgi:uncharacterized protein YqeY
MNLKERLSEDMKTAMKAQDKRRLDAIRLMNAAIKQQEIDSRTSADQRISLDDAQVLAILNKMIKQRRDSISQYQVAKRQDLVDQEDFEIQVIQAYMPAQLGEAEIDQLISATLTATGATSAKDMGKVMAELKSKLQGRADMAAVGAKVKERLK